MNIHEYQAKQILAQYGIIVPNGGIAYTAAEAKRVAQHISSRGPWMLKAQIQAGARHSGHFVGNSTAPKGGIRLVTQIRNLSYEAAQMLNNTLITEQTGPKGKLVSKVYVEAYKQVKHLFYAGMIIDSSLPAITLLISDVIDQDILKIADIRRERILRLPLAYDRDMQEDKSSFFEAYDTVISSVRIFTEMVRTAKWNKSVMAAGCDGGYLNATDIADYLVRKGMPFRTAHGVSAGLVRIAIEKNCRLEELSFAEYEAASPLFEKDIFDLITPEKCVEIRRTIGGPAPSEVQKQIEKLSAFIKENTLKDNDSFDDLI